MIPSLESLVSAVVGMVWPFLAQRLKGTMFGSSKMLILLTGIVGSLAAWGANFLSVSFGSGVELPLSQLLLLGFGIAETTSQLTYRTWLKKGKK